MAGQRKIAQRSDWARAKAQVGEAKALLDNLGAQLAKAYGAPPPADPEWDDLLRRMK